MISLSKFRANLYPVFRLAKITTVGFEVVYLGKVYDISITPSDKQAKLNRTTKRKRKAGVNPELVDMTTCELCDTLTVSGLCLNKSCANSQL